MVAVVISAMHMSVGDEFEMPLEFAKSLRRADDLTKRMVVCTAEALKSAPALEIDPEQIGIFSGTGFGPLETNFRFLDTLFDDGEGQASPTLFSHSVHNAAAGYIARLFNMHGPAITLTSYAWPFLTALNQALLAISDRTISRAVVVTGEMTSPLLTAAGPRLDSNHKDGRSGAVTWIIDKGFEEDPERYLKIKHLEINEKSCDVSTFLTRSGEMWALDGRTSEKTGGLLNYAFFLTECLKENFSGSKTEDRFWGIKAPFGNAVLHFE